MVSLVILDNDPYKHVNTMYMFMVITIWQARCATLTPTHLSKSDTLIFGHDSRK